MGHEIKRVHLPPRCDTAFALALHEELAREITTLAELQLFASAVEHINTPAIQLLVLIARVLGTENIPLSVETCSPAFVAAFGHLGLDAQMSQWRTA